MLTNLQVSYVGAKFPCVTLLNGRDVVVAQRELPQIGQPIEPSLGNDSNLIVVQQPKNKSSYISTENGKKKQ